MIKQGLDKKMWNVQKSADLYHVDKWGAGFFAVNTKGHVEVRPTREPGQAIDLKILVDELLERGIQMPILVRFSDILQERVAEIHRSFERAMREYDYKSGFQGVYPIKVNQQKQVVESLMQAGRKYHLGLEAGSKPELLTVLAMIDDAEALVICNGYKDEEFIELGLLGRKLGINVIQVVEKFSELELILNLAKRLEVRPCIGLRARLSAKGAGRWEASAGDRSKFGLGAVDMLRAVEFLHAEGFLEDLRLLHYHLGSQISSIRHLREAVHEAVRYYIELKKLGAPLQFLDVGGGLAVDYDGSQADLVTSANYSVQEYANTVVYEILAVCDEAEEAHPTIVTEAGRAITAYHSVLLTNVLGTSSVPAEAAELPEEQEAPWQIRELWDVYQGINGGNIHEAFHDLQYWREQLLRLFNLGTLDLPWRARGEAILWAALHRIWGIANEQEELPLEMRHLDQDLADTYFCNMSVFQSLPDAWAIGQVFPIMPIHRLQEAPTRAATLADISCDSDGKINKFVGLRGGASTLPLHELQNGDEYILGFFLVGAYQEILGDLHNLFGDNNAVQVSWDEDLQTYRIDHVEDGDTVTEVLNYVQHNREELINRFRHKVERAVRRKWLEIQASRYVLEMYRSGFDGYTYME